MTASPLALNTTKESKMQFRDLSLKQQIEEVIACVAFLVFLVVMMFLPDLTTL